MGKEMGEFQQRPKVQEAIPVPLRRRRPTGWVIATILFAVIAIGAISFIVFDKMSTKKPAEITRKEDKKSQIDDTVTKNGFALESDSGTFYVTKSGEVYLNPSEDTEKDKDGNWTFRMRVSDYDKDKMPGTLGKYTITEEDIVDFKIGPGNYAVDDYTITFDGFKIDIDNVVAIEGPLYFGVGVTGYNYAFIKSDGTMSWLNLSSGDSTTKASAILTNDVGGYDDVASVFSASPTGHLSRVMVVKKNGSQEWMDHDLLNKLVGLEEKEE